MTTESNIIVQLGAFLAGALLAETNFRTQIEADIRPFRGLLLGLFFLTTGTSIDLQVKMMITCGVLNFITSCFVCVFSFYFLEALFVSLTMFLCNFKYQNHTTG